MADKRYSTLVIPVCLIWYWYEYMGKKLNADLIYPVNGLIFRFRGGKLWEI